MVCAYTTCVITDSDLCYMQNGEVFVKKQEAE